MILNGKSVTLDKSTTIEELLNQYNINLSRVVVELNREIICKEDYSKINLEDDDTIEVISFVGGG